jgi:hypothetical protein
VITPSDYFGDGGLQFDVVNVNHNVHRCSIRIRHAHVECAYCDRRFVLNLEMFDKATHQQLQDHAARHRDA